MEKASLIVWLCGAIACLIVLLYGLIEITTNFSLSKFFKAIWRKVMNIFNRRARIKASASNIEAWLASKTDWDNAKKQDFMEKLSAVFTNLADGKIGSDELEKFERMIYP